ncbi:MAG: portal protein [Dehalococcoidia bacterium]|nr:portal protein [Dehalococcoidia bacterium]
MYIIVAGGGKVGYYLSKSLIEAGHEVLIIEQSAAKCRAMTDELGNVVLLGDACEVTTLMDAGTARAEVVIAVTGDDEDNLVICQVSKIRFRVPVTIARINNPKNEAIFKKMGIDITVSATNVIMEQIQLQLPSHPTLHLMKLHSMGLEVVEVKIPSGAKAVGKQIKDLSLPPDSTISLVINKTLEEDDEVVAVTKTEHEEALREALIGAGQ